MCEPRRRLRLAAGRWGAATLAATLVAGLVAGCTTRQPPAEPGLPHHVAGGFRNNHAQIDADQGGGFLRWQWERLWADLPDDAPQRVPVARPDRAALRANSGRAGGDVTVTWLGHATALWQVAGLNILLDPHIGDRASPVSFAGPKRLTAPPLPLADLPHIDLVLVSHNHFDHLDRATVQALQAQAGGPPLFVVPLGMDAWLQDEGITRTRALDWWQQHTLAAPDGPVQVHLVPAQHWSRRSLFDRNETLWGGFVVQARAAGAPVSLYYAGDTGYSPDFADIGRRFGGVDLALIPVGCHAPRWFMQRQHVDTDEAMRIHADVHSRLSVGVHWGAFRLCDDPIDAPLDSLPAARARAGVADAAFVLLALGETRVVRRGRP